MFIPVAPSPNPQPAITSSTSCGSIFALWTACSMACPSIAAPCVLLKPPRNDLARPVRAVEAMTTVRAAIVWFWRDSEATAKEIESLRRPLSYCSRATAFWLGGDSEGQFFCRGQRLARGSASSLQRCASRILSAGATASSKGTFGGGWAKR